MFRRCYLKNISRIVKKVRDIDKKIELNNKLQTSKNIYNMLFTQSMKEVRNHRIKDKNIFKKLHKKVDNSNIRITNFKSIWNELPTEKLFNNRYDSRCKGRKDEDISHIFVSCK